MTPLIQTAEKHQETIKETVAKLATEASSKLVYLPWHGRPMPEVKRIGLLVEELRGILFPGYHGESVLQPETYAYHVGVSIDKAFRELTDQISKSLCFECIREKAVDCDLCQSRAPEMAAEFIAGLPEIRRLLATDVRAAFRGDPAAKSVGEVIFSYPTIRALTNHRIANALYKLNVPLLPRIIAELAHSEAGIDIHPGAQIGECFAIDHGTGVVIGETAIIGDHVKIFQGVTLGAKSFPVDDNGDPVKGQPRHPIVEDNVIIYSNASILGRITIGKGSVIGGNIWVTRDVSPGSKIIQQRPHERHFADGAGI
jgi:serine O-acetyltransferase